MRKGKIRDGAAAVQGMMIVLGFVFLDGLFDQTGQIFLVGLVTIVEVLIAVVEGLHLHTLIVVLLLVFSVQRSLPVPVDVPKGFALGIYQLVGTFASHFSCAQF